MAPISSRAAALANGAFVRMPTTRRTTSTNVTRVISRIIPPVATRSHRTSRSMRPGSPMMRIARKTSSSTG